MRFFLVFALLSGTAAAATEAWRWVDKNGTVHYGDTAHPDAKPIDVKPASGNGPTPQAIQRAEDCKRQKGELETFRAAASLSEVDEKGKLRQYSPEERQKYLDVAEQKMNETCGLKSPARP